MSGYPALDGSQPCADTDLTLWFQDVADENEVVHPEALELCLACPFYEPCLSYAITHPVEGVWAATTKNQRRAMRRRNGFRVLNDQEAARQLIALLDDGTRTATAVAELVGCSDQTVFRQRARSRAAS